MNQYKISFYDRNAFDPQDREQIQRGFINARDEQEARDIFQFTNCEVISVELAGTDMQTALIQQRMRILAAFDEGPLNKEEADELFHELLEIDDHLQPEYAEARRVADNFNFDNVEEVKL